MTEETKQMELNNKIEDILVSYSKYSDYLRDDLRTLINQQIKAVLDELNGKQFETIVGYGGISGTSPGITNIDSVVSLSDIRQIEKRYSDE